MKEREDKYMTHGCDNGQPPLNLKVQMWRPNQEEGFKSCYLRLDDDVSLAFLIW